VREGGGGGTPFADLGEGGGGGGGGGTAFADLGEGGGGAAFDDEGGGRGAACCDADLFLRADFFPWVGSAPLSSLSLFLSFPFPVFFSLYSQVWKTMVVKKKTTQSHQS